MPPKGFDATDNGEGREVDCEDEDLMDVERDEVPFDVFFKEDFNVEGPTDELVDDMDEVDDEGWLEVDTPVGLESPGRVARPDAICWMVGGFTS